MQKLTELDISTLIRLMQLEDFCDCKNIYGNTNHLRKLERHGLLKFSGRNECESDIDGNDIGARCMFGFTDIGRKVAQLTNEYEDISEFGFEYRKD